MSLWNSTLWNQSLWNGGSSGGGIGSVTARRLIYDAYRALGVLRPGQQTSPEGHEDAFGLLNDMVDSWNTESLMIPALQRGVYPLTAGVSSYTLGPGGTLSGDRPQRVMSAALVLRSGWLDCGCNCGIHIDNAYPNANVRINPAPSDGQSLALQSWQTLSGFADLDSQYGFPPGYVLALRWGLALQLAPAALIMMKVPNNLLQVIEQRAIDSKAAVKSFNSSPIPEMNSGFGGCGYDICSDSYC